MFGRLQPVLRAVQAPRLFRCAFQQTQVAGFANAYGNNKKKSSGSENNKFSNVQAAVAAIRMNEQLRYPSMRVVYPNAETGDMEWKILSRAEALDMAHARSLDLILVNDKADPPVCKLERYSNKVKDLKAKEKDLRVKEKARIQKEMFMTGGIEERDFTTKMDKVASFMRKGHAVKVTIVPKRFTKNHRFKDGVRRDRMEGFDETILMLLTYLEDQPVLVTEQKVRAPPPRTTMVVKGKKVAVGAVEKVKAPKISGGLVQGGDDDDDKELGESAEDADEPPPENDDESDSEGEEDGMTSGGGQVGFNGQRLILRREFLLTPKAEMLKQEKK